MAEAVQAPKVENVIIVGGGPAGLAAGLYTARADLNPLIIAGSPPGGQLMLTSDVENYPGFEAIQGPELIQKLRDHTAKFGTRFLDENVTSVNLKAIPFELTTISGTYHTHSLIITVGASALWLGLENETRLRGKGVSACATCDGFFFKEKVVGVVGGGDTAAEEALFLTRFASKVYLYHRRDTLKASKIMADRVLNNPKIECVWNTQVTDVLGAEHVEGVKLSTGGQEREQKLDGLFLAIGHKPDTGVFRGKIELDEKGYIVTSVRAALEKLKSPGNNPVYFETYNPAAQSATSVPGVFAAGDCVDFSYRQAGTASGMGIAAALDAERWLEGHLHKK